MPRRIEIKFVADLAKGTRKANQVTIDKMTREIGEFARQLFSQNGFTATSTEVTRKITYFESTKTFVLMAIRHLKNVA